MALAGLRSENKVSCRNSGWVMRCIVEAGQSARLTHPIPTPPAAHNLGAWKLPLALKMARTPLLSPPPKFHSCFDAHLTSPLPVLKSVCFWPVRAVGGGTSWLCRADGLSQDSQTVTAAKISFLKNTPASAFRPSVFLSRESLGRLLLSPQSWDWPT